MEVTSFLTLYYFQLNCARTSVCRRYLWSPADVGLKAGGEGGDGGGWQGGGEGDGDQEQEQLDSGRGEHLGATDDVSNFVRQVTDEGL